MKREEPVMSKEKFERKAPHETSDDRVIDHGKTTLTAAITKTLAEQSED